VNSNSIVTASKNTPIVSITDEEELIKTKDISKFIEKAIQQKNYRLAVRYYYIHILKQLEQQQFISWEQQKTNDDYSNEISEETIQSSFIKLTRLYDFVWYGNFAINEIEFAKIETDFIEINHLIHKK
jgi:disulfide oxidoreductase YuzD